MIESEISKKNTKSLLSPSTKGILLALGAVSLFVIMDAISKHLAKEYPVSMIIWVRYLFHTLLFVVALGPKLGKSLIRTEHVGLHVLRGLLLFSAVFCFVSAIKVMPLAEATTIGFLNPILTMVLAVLLLSEKVEFGRWMAVLGAFIGVLIIVRPGTAVFTLAVFWPLGNALSSASYQVFTRKMAATESSASLIFYPGLVGLVASSFLFSDAWHLPAGPAPALMLALVGCLSGAGHLLLIKALSTAPASTVAPFTYTQVLLATLVGWLVFGNLPDYWSFLGMFILLVSGVYCVTHQRRMERRATAQQEDPVRHPLSPLPSQQR